MPGDDIRGIDWRLWARTDRHYIKLYEAETNANFVILLDVSRSMAYGSGEVTKLDYARYLSACLAFSRADSGTGWDWSRSTGTSSSTCARP